MVSLEFATEVSTPHPVRMVFDYLADPRNRPEWQSSLRSVRPAESDATPRVGLTWEETTVVGVRPQLRIDRLEPDRVWAETGTWRGVTGTLTLHFETLPFDDTADGCRVRAAGTISGAGIWAIPTRAASLLASRSIASDLRRASRILAHRGLRP